MGEFYHIVLSEFCTKEFLCVKVDWVFKVFIM